MLAMVRGCDVSSLGGSFVVVLAMRMQGCLVVEGGDVAGLVVLDLPCCSAVCITAGERRRAKRAQREARESLKRAADVVKVDMWGVWD